MQFPATMPTVNVVPVAGLAVVQPQVTFLAGLSVLVVDDDMDILDLMRFILEKVGAEVTVVNSVQGAIAALTSSPGKYDVLLADIGMPEEDGFALIHQVRVLDQELGGQIPAAAITAYANDREQQLALNAGFQRHLAKPIDSNQLIWLVANLAGRVPVEQ
jgi:two-component system, chemotaxis family, CheB/CheR fusion protein